MVMSLKRIVPFATATVLALSLVWPAAAQEPAQPPSGKWVQPPSDVPKAQRGDCTRNIEFLFEALKVAPDDESAKAIENRIWALWVVSGSDTCDLLMTRAKQAMDDKNLELALKLLSAIIEIRPGYIEA